MAKRRPGRRGVLVAVRIKTIVAVFVIVEVIARRWENVRPPRPVIALVDRDNRGKRSVTGEGRGIVP